MQKLIQNLASATLKMASWPQGLSDFFQKIHFLNEGKALKKVSYSSACWKNFKITNFNTFMVASKDLEVAETKFWISSIFNEF